MRILCYNIHGGYSRRGRRDLGRIHDLMEREDADIGVFQEIETRPSRGGTQKDVAVIAGPSRPHHLIGLALQEEGGWYGNLIVSRHPILRGIVHDLETPPALEARNAVDALVQTPRGRLRIVGTHLSLLSSARWREVRRLRRLIDEADRTEKHPMLLMGDINEWRGGAALLRHLDEVFTPLPAARTFPSFLPLFHLDRVWAHGVRGASVRRLDSPALRELSDHLPLLVELPGAEPEGEAT